MLLSLASELIQAISYELQSIEDIKSFRLTCKQMDQALATEVLRSITVNINKETCEKELCKLQYLAEGSSYVSIQGIRQVDIKTLSPALDPKYPWAPRVSGEGNAAAERAALEYHEEELKKCLYNALSSLTNVRTVRWIPNDQDAVWAHTAVMDAIQTFPHLQSIYMELHSCHIEIPFHFFTALRHISIYHLSEDANHSDHHRNLKTFENLVKMISQSPLLQSIDFSNSYSQGRISTRSLHQLFECYPDNGSPLRLKHLSVSRCLVRLDDETVMRHLRYLTSLSVVDLLEPSTTRHSHSEYYDDADANDSISEDILETQQRWGSSYEQIWGTIRNADWRLEEIILHTIPSAFVEYIGSYSGLKKLTIGTGGFKDGVASDSAGKKFYEALERHVGSIEELDVNAYFEGLWCFGHHNKVLFSTMRNLTRLSIKLQSSDFLPRSELGHSSSQDIVTVLIDTAVIYMPQLQTLSAYIADSEYNRYSRCGSGTGFHYSRYNRKIVARVLKYKAPWGSRRLPMFTTAGGSWFSKERVFVGRRLDLLQKGERLGFDEVSSHRFEYDVDNIDSDEE